MKPKTRIAIILIALGITTFAYQDITYTTREKVFDLSPIQVTSETTKTLPLPPIVGAIAGSWEALYCWSWEAKGADQRQNISTTRNLL